jgi:hypothetical protein
MAKSKNSSLWQTFVNYSRKKFNDIGTWCCWTRNRWRPRWPSRPDRPSGSWRRWERRCRQTASGSRTWGAETLSLTAFGITTLGVPTKNTIFGITTLDSEYCCDECRVLYCYAERRYAECCYTECRGTTPGTEVPFWHGQSWLKFRNWK